MWNANGVLIQALNEKTKFIKKLCYQGINAYFQYPLIGLRDIESRRLTDEQLYSSVSDGFAVSLEFISNSDLYMRYLNKCKAMQIEVRALFIESAYSDEIWKDELPQMNFMGYEYCPIPIDEQIITDMDWYEPFSRYHNKLNQYGLFDSYEDALEFVQEYNVAMKKDTLEMVKWMRIYVEFLKLFYKIMAFVSKRIYGFLPLRIGVQEVQHICAQLLLKRLL